MLLSTYYGVVWLQLILKFELG